MRNKGQSLSLSNVLIGLTIVGLIGLFIFLFITRGQDIEVKVEENEILRRKIILTSTLISSDKLVYSEGSTIHRGVLDKQKLDEIISNPKNLFELTYPETDYSVKVVDLDNDNKWIISGDFEPTFKTPVSIRYSDDVVHLGFLSIDFSAMGTCTLPVHCLDFCAENCEPFSKCNCEDGLCKVECKCGEINSCGDYMDEISCNQDGCDVASDLYCNWDGTTCSD